MTTNQTHRFWPDGWDHLKPDFHVALTVVEEENGFRRESNFARVQRDKDGHEYEVWFCGLGETFNNAAQAVHHLRFLARHVASVSGNR